MWYTWSLRTFGTGKYEWFKSKLWSRYLWDQWASFHAVCRTIPINAQCRSKSWHWSEMSLNANQFWSIPLNADQCRSMPDQGIIKTCLINSAWSGIDRHWEELIGIDRNWSTLGSMPEFWSALIGIGHWSRESCVCPYTSSSVTKQLLIVTRISVVHAQNCTLMIKMKKRLIKCITTSPIPSSDCHLLDAVCQLGVTCLACAWYLQLTCSMTELVM